MSLDAKVSALTGQLKSNFWKAWSETAKPAPYEKFTTTIPSTTKIEHYINFSPVPGLSEWLGSRNYGTVDSFIYSVQNKKYHSGFKAKLEDIEDDQTGGLAAKPAELSKKAKIFPGREVLRVLADGKNQLGFDGTNFFANSHSFGSGDNLLAFDGAAGDALTYKLAALYCGDDNLKPMFWQNRAGPDFDTNAGTKQSKESGEVRWWVDLRGRAGVGMWFNAILVEITDTPTVAEMHTIYQAIENAFRTFQLPKTISTDTGEYVHEQTEFTSENLHLVGSTGLATLLKQSLGQDWVPQNVAVSGATNTAPTTNLFKGWASWSVSAFMN